MEKVENLTKPVIPNYPFMFDFEEKFVHLETREWMLNHWTSGFYLCGFYIAVIFTIQSYMQNREKFNLRKILVVWNTCLAVFSIIGASRTLPELVYVLRHLGLYHSVCVQR